MNPSDAENLRDFSRGVAAVCCAGALWWQFSALKRGSHRPLLDLLQRRAALPLFCLVLFMIWRISSDNPFVSLALNSSVIFYVALSERGRKPARAPGKRTYWKHQPNLRRDHDYRKAALDPTAQNQQRR